MNAYASQMDFGFERPASRYEYLRRFGQLVLERSSWLAHWRDLAEQLQPQRFRYFQTDRNKGYKRNDSIINSTPLIAVRTLAAGMMSGITSPARLWFRLMMSDADLAEYEPVKEWLEIVERRVFETFAQSNVYNSLQTGYTDLGAFGTHVAIVEEDHRDVIRLYCPPVGRYALANGARLEPDTMFREDSLTVGQLVEQFGLKRCSPFVQNAWKQGNYSQWVDIVHAIEPNRYPDPTAADHTGKAWKSCWFERGAGSQLQFAEASGPGGDHQFLAEGGYEEFPVLAPRWNVTGVDVYGTSAGMDVLGDARALQLYEKRSAQVLDKIVNPPLVSVGGSRATRLSLLPGDVNHVDAVQNGKPLYPAIEVSPSALPAVMEEKRTIERRINTGLFADLFLMLASQPEGGDMTAREVAERHEEKLIALGPVLERVNTEYLAPLVNRTMGIMARKGLLPPAPQELKGQDYKVEFISVLAQAQKLLGVTSNDRAWAFASTVAQARPEVLDRVNVDKLLEDQFDRLGVSPKVIVPEDEAQKVRDSRAKQQQAQAQGQALLAASQGAKNLAQSPTDGRNALTDIANTLSPAAAGIAEGAI